MNTTCSNTVFKVKFLLILGSRSITDHNLETDGKFKHLWYQFFKKKVSKMILALPYCDFIKTAKTKY